ncbi:MAG: hypothetical protein ACFFAH_09550 [Promethearchaeota archaeon]
MDSSGNVHVAWQDDTDYDGSGGDRDIFYKRWNATTSVWTTTEVVSTESTGISITRSHRSIAVDGSGNAHVAWHDNTDYDSSGGDNDIFYKRWNATTGEWTTTEVVSTESTDDSYQPSIALDSSGNAHVVWYDYTDYSGSGTDIDIFYNRWNGDTSEWTTTEVVSTESTGNSSTPSIAVDGSENVHVTWEDETNYCGSGTEMDIFYKCRNADTSEWTTTEVVSTESTGLSWISSIAVDGSGNAHVVWYDNTTYDSSGSDNDIFYKKGKVSLPLPPSGGGDDDDDDDDDDGINTAVVLIVVVVIAVLILLFGAFIKVKKVKQVKPITKAAEKEIKVRKNKENEVKERVKTKEKRIEPKVELKRGIDFVGGLIRYKVAIKNTTETTINNLEISLKMVAPHIRIVDIKPRVYKRGDHVQINALPPGESFSIDFYLEPMICGNMKAHIVGSYIDAWGNTETFSREPLNIISKCPPIIIPGEENIAKVINVYESENMTRSSRSFKLEQDPRTSFNLLNEAIRAWAGKQVSEPIILSNDPFKSKAYFYILNQNQDPELGHQEQIVIKINIDEEKNVAMIYVSAEKNPTVIGVLNHIWELINRRFGEEFGFKFITHECDQCGAQLKVIDKYRSKVICEHCGTEFEIKSLKSILDTSKI